MKTKSYLIALTLIFFTELVIARETGTYKDSRDGKAYKTVKIGSQTWMAENLAFQVTSGCWAFDNKPANVAIYGYLYDWQTAKQVCPSGWHLPSDAEWTTFITFLGGKNIAGGKLKESGTQHWLSPNGDATVSIGFSALPGGYRHSDGTFDIVGASCRIWSSTESRPNFYARIYTLNMFDGQINGNDGVKNQGAYVRCIKD